MAQIKVFLEKDETIDEVKDLLRKALDLHNHSDDHTDSKFEDPLIDDICLKMDEIQQEIYRDLIEEVNQLLDKEYSDGHFS